jgi:hypothetical protein
MVFSYLFGISTLTYVAVREEFYDGIRLRFWDMRAALDKWPSCYERWGLKTFAFSEVNIESQGECSRFNYGIFTMPLYRLMSLISKNELLWVVGLSVLALALILYIADKSPTMHLFALFVLVSPPITLLFESGNPDLLNIVLCLVAGIAIYRKWMLVFLFSTSAVALHKYYGLAAWAVIPLSYFKLNKIKSILATVVTIGTISVIGYQVVFMGLYQFSDAASNHYGITIWDNYFRKLGFEIPEILVQLVAITSLILIWAYIWQRQSIKFELRRKLSLSETTGLIFYLVFTFSYLTTSNVDYRLAFLGVGIILDFNHFIAKGFYNRAVLIFIFSSLFFVYQIGYSEIISGFPTQVLGDIALHLAVIYLGARSMFLIKQLRIDQKI